MIPAVGLNSIYFGPERSRYIFLDPVLSFPLVTLVRNLFSSKGQLGSRFTQNYLTPLPLNRTFCTPSTAIQPPASVQPA